MGIEKIVSNGLELLNPAKSAGKTLMVLNAIGIGFAAASNTFAAATDKNTSAEDKKFLVPAGGATGLANLGIYFGMTSKLIDKLKGKDLSKLSEKKLAKLTEKLTKEQLDSYQKGVAGKVIDYMVENKTFDKNANTFIDSRIAKAAKKIKDPELLASMKETLKDKEGNLTDFAKDMYKNNIKEGFSVAGAFIGAVVGCAIITPILRDVSAYAVQKLREKKDPSLKDKPYRPYFDISHVRAGKYPYGKPINSKQPLSMMSYMNFTNGRTKI